MAVQFPLIDIKFETPFANLTLILLNLLRWSPDWGNNLTPPSTMPPTWQWYHNNTKLQTTSQQPTLQSKLWSVPVSLAASAAIDAGSNYLSNLIMGNLNDSELGRNLGTIFSSGISSAGNTLSNNLIKGLSLTTGLANNVGASVAGAGAGIAANYIGKGINSLGGDTMLSRGISQGVATGLGSLGGTMISNIFAGNSLLNGLSGTRTSMDILRKTGTLKPGEALKASKLANANLIGLGMSVVGSGLQAAFGPSKEYNGRYGNITRTMDSVYDTVQAGVGFIPGAGTVISGAMALNKGLSNIFGSTSGMTKTDAILGSAFMPAPVKWLNMAGASTTGNFYNLSWLNMEKTNSFMGNAFGNLRDRFDNAREEAGKTYGTFSQGSKNRALNNINFANQAWTKINSMADLNELQNIRSLYMTSINNLRYAQEIGGVWQPIYRGKQGMKILNNATNHNIGMRLLSAAALIDNKQMILSAQGGTKVRRPARPLPRKPATREENPELWDEWERRDAERNASKQRVYLLEKEAATRRAETNARHALHYSNLATGVAETVQLNALFEPVTQESLQNSNTEQLRLEQLADKNEYFDNGMKFIDAAGTAMLLADAGPIAASIARKGFKWAFNKAGLLVKIPISKSDMKPFLDDYGREVIPTPWKGTDLELVDLILKNLVNVLRDYFSPLKKEQVMKAMNWGEKEYSEFLDELMRSIGTLTEGEVKGPKDGFTIIALHRGEALGEGENMTGHHVMTFNRERIPDEKMATEAIIHEIGGHGKTMSINPNKSNKISEAFPRITLLMLKNQELANNILELNGRGKFFSLFPKVSDLELYVYNNNVPKHKIENLFNQRRYFNYMTNDILERAARAYTGLLMDKLGFDKTLNVQLLERYYTPESVEKFKNAVLNYGVPITVGGSTAVTLYNKSK